MQTKLILPSNRNALAKVSPILVRESIPLKPEFANPEAALLAGQKYDDAADENAHHAQGHLGHARFMFEPPHEDEPGKLTLLYSWRDSNSLELLLASEDDILAPWFEKHAAGPRVVTVMFELPVEV